MDDQDLADVVPPTWEGIAQRRKELHRPIDADFEGQVAPLRRRREDDAARTEREYATRMQEAKNRLYHAQREFKETERVLKTWKAATLKAIAREYASAAAPARDERWRRKQPIVAWYDRQLEHLREWDREHPQG